MMVSMTSVKHTIQSFSSTEDCSSLLLLLIDIDDNEVEGS